MNIGYLYVIGTRSIASTLTDMETGEQLEASLEGIKISAPLSVAPLVNFLIKRAGLVHGAVQLEKAICGAILYRKCVVDGISSDKRTELLHLLTGTSPGARPGSAISKTPGSGGKNIYEKAIRLVHMDAEVDSPYKDVLTNLNFTKTYEDLVT